MKGQVSSKGQGSYLNDVSPPPRPKFPDLKT